MEHFLSKKDESNLEQEVELDVSFILKHINTLVTGMPLEIMLLKFYRTKAVGDDNTYKKFRDYVKSKFKVDTDLQLYNYISKNKYTRIVIKIKNTIDALIYREFGCEVTDAVFVDYVIATSEKVIIKLKITR